MELSFQSSALDKSLGHALQDTGLPPVSLDGSGEWNTISEVPSGISGTDLSPESASRIVRDPHRSGIHPENLPLRLSTYAFSNRLTRLDEARWAEVAPTRARLLN